VATTLVCNLLDGGLGTREDGEDGEEDGDLHDAGCDAMKGE
jgi:hypothetical protein